MMRCLVKLCVVKLIDENTYKVNIGCKVMHPLLIQYFNIQKYGLPSAFNNLFIL